MFIPGLTYFKTDSGYYCCIDSRHFLILTGCVNQDCGRGVAGMASLYYVICVRL